MALTNVKTSTSVSLETNKDLFSWKNLTNFGNCSFPNSVFGNGVRPPLKNLSWWEGSFNGLLEISSETKQQAGKLNNTLISTRDLKKFADSIVKKYNCKSLRLDKKSVIAIAKLACETAKKYGVDERLVLAVIEQESKFKNGLTSYAGAKGLMQLMPATAKALGVKNPMNAAENIDGGVRLIRDLLKQYKGNVKLALAAYNAGQGNVKKYGGIPPFKQTQTYVKEISKNYYNYKNISLLN